MYLGEFEEDGEKCRADVVKVEHLPKKCSSFVYDGVICRPSYVIETKDSDYGLSKKTIINIYNNYLVVFIFYCNYYYYNKIGILKNKVLNRFEGLNL